MIGRWQRIMSKEFHWTRRKVLWMLLLPLFVFLLFTQFQQVGKDRNGCERANITRQVAIESNDLDIRFVQTAQEARARSARVPERVDPRQRQIDARAAENYAEIAQGYEDLNTLITDTVATVATEPGTYTVNCKKAYPLPFPLNLTGH